MTFQEIHSTNESKFLSLPKLAVIVLKEAGRAMSVKEITQKILEKRFIASNTPSYSVGVALQRSEKIKKINKGMYDLI